MRVISGKYRGKKLKGFDIEGTRPTMDRVKESLFAMIQPKIANSSCLDLYAGSGALGIEALSNGAKNCTFVDSNFKVIAILKENLSTIENVQLLKMTAMKAIAYLSSQNQTFDIIFLDPPYSKQLITKTIQQIQQNQLLNQNGLLICEFVDEKIECELPIFKEKQYHDKKITIYVNK